MSYKFRSIPLILACCVLNLLAAQQEGTLSGVVTNQSTGALLQDATVEIPALNRILLTDQLGRFFVSQVPYGDYEIIVSYMDLDTQRQNVTLNEQSPSASLDFPLTSEVYKLETFVVTGEREGTAAALTRQRTADNVKNVVSLDAMGQLPNENPGELLAQIAGISGDYDENGDIVTINIRGIDSSLSTVTYDGAQMANSFGVTSRSFRFLNINASTFEELEVIKALTPDVSAASLGGTVNMKTKSTLNMKENLRLDWRATATYSPGFFDYSPRREDHPWGPLFSLDYRQIFSVGDGNRNLGVYLNLFHRNKLENSTRTETAYATSRDESDAYLYRHRTVDNVNTKYNSSATLRFDYKLSDRSRFYLTAMYSQQRDWVEPGMEPMESSFTSNYTTVDGVITPGYVDTSVSNSYYTKYDRGGRLDLIQGYMGFFDAQYRAQFGGEHILDKVSIDYDLAFSRSDVELDGNKDEPYAGMRSYLRVSNIGAIIDRQNADAFPVFEQTFGSGANSNSIYDIDTYKSYSKLQHRQGTRTNTVIEGKLNAKTNLSIFNTPVQLVSGVAFRRDDRGEMTDSQQYSFSGDSLTPFLANVKIDPRFGSSIVGLPRLDLGAMSRDFYANSGNWTQNHGDYFWGLREARANTRDLNEDVYAFYLMGKVRFGKLSILAGARLEHTRASGEGWVRRMVTYEANYRPLIDSLGPIASAQQRIEDEYGTSKHKEERNYSDIFPSLHFTYSFTKNLIARASYSTGIGRPAPRQLIPGISVNESEGIVTESNPDLVPQYAHNLDLTLEYYLPKAGILSVGFFHKQINDFIYTSTGGSIGYGPDNGYGGEYEGLTLNKQFNGNQAKIDGIEFSYNQLLTFLPQPFKWTRFTLSYTWLRTEGDYGDNATSLSTKDVPGFRPQNLSARLTWNYKKLVLGLQGSYMDDYLLTYSPLREKGIYRKGRFQLSANAEYRFHKYLNLRIDVGNMFNEPFVNYQGKESRTSNTNYNGQYFAIGIYGRY